MGYNIGPTISVKGDKEYTTALRKIKDNMKLVASEASVMTAQFGRNNSSISALKAKNESLSKALQQQKSAVSEAEQALKRMDQAGVKPTDRSYVQMKTNLNNAKAALESTKREIKENETVMQRGEKGAKQYSEKLKTVGTVAGKVAKTSLKAFAVAAGAVTAAVGTAIVKFAQGIKDVADFGDNIDKNSQRLGLSREAYQEWDFVLSQSGVDINTMQVGLKTLTNTIDDAKNGVPSAIEKFSRLGITMDDVSNLSREEIFAETIKGLQNMTDETARAALANDLFGRSGQEIIPLLNQTAESTEALRQKAIDYGFVMSDQAVAASVAFTDSLDLLSHTATGLKNKFIAEFLPSVTTAMDGLSLLFTGDLSGVDKINEGIQGFIDKLSEIMPEVASVGGSIVQTLITSLVSNLPGFIGQALPTMIGSISSMITLLFTTIVQILPTAIPLIVEAASGVMSTILQTLQQNAAPISQAVVQIVMMFAQFLIQNLPLIIQTGLQIVIALAQGIASSLPELVPAIVDMILQIVLLLTNPDMVLQLTMAALQIIFALTEGLVAAIPTLIESIPQIVINIALALAETAVMLWETGKGFITQLSDGISEQLSELFAVVGGWVNDNILQPILDKVSEFADVGRNLIEGIWEGIGDKVEWLKSKVKGIVDKIKGWFTGSDGFDSHSPSRWGEELGRNVLYGLSGGMVDGISTAVAAAAKAVNRVKQAMSGEAVNIAVNGNNGIGNVGTPGASYVFHIYAKDKETAVEAADATLAAFQRSRWAVST